MSDRRKEHTLSVGAAVRFTYRGETIHGHVVERQGQRRLAKVVDDGERTWSVPEAALTASGRARRATLLTPHDEARAGYRVGDGVTFTGPDGAMRGEIAKLNPKRALVRRGGSCWTVPYGQLRRTDGDSARSGAEQLNAVAAMARRLMDEHGLADWTLAFVESRRRLGDCRFRDRVIRIGRAHALEGAAEQVRDAIAGPEAGHGPLWRAMARRIGATPRARAYENQAC